MDYIKSWTFCICITLIISVIFSVLSPKGSMGRFYKAIISMFIFLSFLYPLSDFNIADFKLDFDFESEYTDVVESSAEMQIESTVGAVLNDNGIGDSVITADVEHKGGELIIKRVLISVTDNYSAEEVKNIVFENLGIVAEVKRIGE